MLTFSHRNPWHWIATFFGIGLMRPAPGTWGSLAAIPFAVLLMTLGNPLYYAAFVFIVVFFGWLACARLARMEDPSEIVIDEVAGMLLALAAARPVIFDIALAFILFRILDIMKPSVIGRVDRSCPGAAGVMGDDLIAGFLVGLVLIGIHYAGYAGIG